VTADTRSIATLALVLAAPVPAAAQTGAAAPLTRAQFEALFARVDNAGRWGGDDQQGTLNLITADIRRAARDQVRDGAAVSLARTIVAGPTEGAFEPAAVDFMQVSDTVLGPSDGSVMWTAERLALVYHGWAYTHVDAPAHMSYHGKGYNAAAAFPGPNGAPERNTVGAMRDGIVTRGVLVDLPRLRGVPYVAPGSGITAEDLEAWERHAGLRIQAGDVLLIRSGRWTPEAAGAGGTAGVHPSLAVWLRERGVAAMGDESGTDMTPPPVPGLNAPFHVLALVAMGMPLFENLDLEQVAREAAARSRWTFLFVAAPLDVRGGTGSPVNPLAVF
jgi:kynurenine formamidase